MIYEDHILKMQDFHGFYAKWTSLIGYYKTHEEAYVAAERIYFTHFKRTRYKDYDSFKVRVSQNFGKVTPEPKAVKRRKRIVKNKKRK